ncbi:MAG TPA: hypothetical protein PLB89_05190 [Flavobacteriales bacterium]|nr:hypothetical protein [Flavobacteriales bacterium]
MKPYDTYSYKELKEAHAKLLSELKVERSPEITQEGAQVLKYIAQRMAKLVRDLVLHRERVLGLAQNLYGGYLRTDNAVDAAAKAVKDAETFFDFWNNYDANLAVVGLSAETDAIT